MNTDQNAFENASESFKRLNPGLFGAAGVVGPLSPGMLLKPPAGERYEAMGDAWERDERELQQACERWLLLRGYRRRVEGVILEGKPERGWFVHLHQAVGNPLLLDLLLLGTDGRYLEVELKTATGKVKRFQGELVKQGAPLCRGMVEFVGAVLDWEKAGQGAAAQAAGGAK